MSIPLYDELEQLLNATIPSGPIIPDPFNMSGEYYQATSGFTPLSSDFFNSLPINEPYPEENTSEQQKGNMEENARENTAVIHRIEQLKYKVEKMRAKIDALLIYIIRNQPSRK